jgi:hypothetical protein
MQSLSVDEVGQGTVFLLAPNEYHSTDWLGITLEGRVAFVPRYAVALKPQPAPPTAATEPVMVAQSGPPASVAPAPTHTTAPAPVTVPTRPGPVEPAPALAPPTLIPVPRTVVPAAAEPAPRTISRPRDDRAAERPVERIQERVPDRTAAREPARTLEHSPERTSEPPVVSARRVGMDLTVGALGSVSRDPANGSTPPLHVAALSFIGAQHRGWGIYLAPEFGNGGGYRSTMLGGGLSRDLLSAHLLRVTALVGYTTYTQTPTAIAGASAPPGQSIRGPSLGGMASIPLLGPVRLAYRGQYVMGQLNGAAVHITRYSAGLLF